MTVAVKAVQRANARNADDEAQALADSINLGGVPGRLVQLIDSRQEGFLLAIFEEG